MLCGIYAGFMFIVGMYNFLFTENILYLQAGLPLQSVSPLGSVQLIGIGCLGEYIGRIYNQTKLRPDFIIKDKALE